MRKFLSLALILWLLSSSTAWAAIAFDAASSATAGGPATSLTFAHTTSGSDRILWVFILTSDDTAGDRVSGVTYAGSTMTRVNGATSLEIAFGQSLYTYYIVAPTTGTNNVVISATESTEIYATAQSYTGASQTGVPDGSNTASAGTISITTTADNAWLAGGGRNVSSGGLTASTGTTQRASIAGIINTGDSGGAKTPAGSHSMAWTPDDANTKLVMVSFAPAPETAVAATPEQEIIVFD